MVESKILAMTREFITAFYELGNVHNIIDVAADSIVGFGTKSLRYSVGKEAVDSLLRHELAAVVPCRMENLKLKEYTAGNGITITASVILRLAKDVSVVMHRLTFMYARKGRGYVLTGVHVVKDLHYAATYKAVSSNILNTKAIPKEIRESSGILSSRMDTAFISFRAVPCYELLNYSDALFKMLGYESKESFEAALGGKTLADSMGKDEADAVYTAFAKQMQEGNEYQVEYRVKDAQGNILWVAECGTYTKEKDNYVCQGIIVNITPLRRISENLSYQIAYDNLTKIYNKEAFCQKVQEVINSNSEINFEIMQLDIRRFKVINDLFGEEASNEILKYIADFFIQAKIPNCVYGRLHADRFLLCYPVENNNRDNFIKSLRILATSFTIAYRIELCFGVYVVMDRTLPVNLMCDRAGLALSKAKRNGLLICGEYTDDMRRDILNEQRIVNRMEDALNNEEFTIYMQPKFELQTEKIIGAEALVRWISKKYGCISPSKFVPVFENNGFIFKLDQFVWRKTCEWLRAWIDMGNEALPVSVNVSRVDLYSTEIVDILTGLVKEFDVPPELFELEITESAYMDNPKQIVETVKKLQKYGFKILMDDFGSGYSSLNMLKDLPVDILKLDLAFLDSHDEKGRGGNILNSVVRMAKWLRIPVICEGVENSQQVEFLRMIGCNWAQGFYYSEPVPLSEYEKMLKAGRGTAYGHNDIHFDIDDLSDLFNSSTQLNMIFNNIGGGIALYEFDGYNLELLRANKGYFDLFGKRTDISDYSGRNMLDNLVEEDKTIFFAALEEAVEKGYSSKFTIRRIIREKRFIWLDVRITMISSDEKEKVFYMSFEDVSAQHIRNKNLQKFIDNESCGVGFYELIDGKLYARYLSSWICDINGISEEELFEQTGGRIGLLLGERWEEVVGKKIVDSFNKKKPMYYEYPFDSPTGRFFWLSMTANVVMQKEGSYYCVAVIQDISNRREKETAASVFKTE